jgi:hypothetical protein
MRNFWISVRNPVSTSGITVYTKKNFRPSSTQAMKMTYLAESDFPATIFAVKAI